jgi:Tol biopolymer transport system component
MKHLLITSTMLLAAMQDDKPWRIVFQSMRPRHFSEFKSVLEDGSGLRSEESEPTPFGWSPDGTRRVVTLAYATSTRIAICGADGAQETPITDGKFKDHMPSWTPDGRIAFASNRSGKSQIWIMDADGKQPQKLTDHPEGAENPRVSAGGRIAYIELHSERSKLPPSTLRTMDLAGRDSKVLIEKSQMLGHAWSPKGDRIACSLVQELRVLEVPSGKTVKSFKLEEVHKDLYAHAAYRTIWRPDGGAIACTVQFLGGRTEQADDFGDDKLFIFPMDGKPAIVEAGGSAFPWRWTR